MALVTILAVWISFNNPTYDSKPLGAVYVADTTGACTPSSTTLTDLASVTLWGTKRGTHNHVVLATKAETIPGKRDSVPFSDNGDVWTVWMTATDTHGNVSRCPSDPIGVNLALDVPWDRPVLDERIYDLHGAVVHGPLSRLKPGVYFRRLPGGRGGKVLVIR